MQLDVGSKFWIDFPMGVTVSWSLFQLLYVIFQSVQNRVLVGNTPVPPSGMGDIAASVSLAMGILVVVSFGSTLATWFYIKLRKKREADGIAAAAMQGIERDLQRDNLSFDGELNDGEKFEEGTTQENMRNISFWAQGDLVFFSQSFASNW